MDEIFKLHIRFCGYGGYLALGKLAGQHYAGKAHFLKLPDPLDALHGHLSGGVHGHIGADLPHERDKPDIL